MTWKEFKEVVEAAGVKDDMHITWIDVTYPDAKSIDVHIPSKENDYQLIIQDG